MLTSTMLSRATRRMGQTAIVQSIWVVMILSTLVFRQVTSALPGDENEFAEFEVRIYSNLRNISTKIQEFDDAPATPPVAPDPDPPLQTSKSPSPGGAQPQAPAHKPVDSDEDDENQAVVEEESDEFTVDEDEFETGDDGRPIKGQKSNIDKKPQTLQFADVPAHLRNNWSNYQVEILMLVGLLVYLVNYIIGKQANQSLATLWFDAHQEMLQEQFALVGDDGTETALAGRSQFVKETDSTISLWCSGRAGTLGLLVQMKMIKRQDLISVISQLVRPRYDHVAIRIELEPNEMDTFVTIIGQRKTVCRLAKEMTDLSQFTTEKKNSAQLGVPASFSVFSEIGEATAAMLDPKVVSMLAKYEQNIEYLHFSDQYCGLKPQEGETVTKLPDTSSVIVLGYNIPGRMSAGDKDIQTVKPLLQLLLHCVDKARRFRLSREAKTKTERNRQTAQESFLKTTHAQRAEAAAARREEKIRERKQRVMEEEDPEKQRRLEKIEQKREAKKKQPRMKQLKVKAG